MLHLSDQAHIHLIATCGTAMGSLAAMLKERGFRITGSDAQVYPPMSTFLQERGIAVLSGFDTAHLTPHPDLVVVGNAVSRGNPEVEYTLEHRIPYLSLPEVLRFLFLPGKCPVVITGTHGKTTTTALTAHLLHQGGLDPSFLVAGIPLDFPQPYHLGSGPFFVIEGDEYDSAFFAKTAKFFSYMPEILVINNIEFDHADIYLNLAAIEKAFAQVINMVPANGLVLAFAQDPQVTALLPAALAPVQTFGVDTNATLQAYATEVSPQGQRFRMRAAEQELGVFDLPLLGAYNIRNALAAAGVALHAGLNADQIRTGLASFKGVKRRQEILGTVNNIILMDDFAHHPTAVSETLLGLRRSHPDRRLWAIFEPASATNARALFEAHYERALATADRVIIASVPKPERARNEPPFSPERLVQALNDQVEAAFYQTDHSAIINQLTRQTLPGDLVVFMSNSGFGNVPRQTLTALQALYPDAS